MATGDVKLAMDGVFKYGAGGSTAGTTADNVDQVKLGMSKEWAEWLRRGKRYKGAKPTVRNVTLEFQMVKIEGDAFVNAMRDAWINDTLMAFYPTDAESGEGLDFDGYVGDWNEDQDNAGAVIVSVSCRLSDEKRQPSYH